MSSSDKKEAFKKMGFMNEPNMELYGGNCPKENYLDEDGDVKAIVYFLVYMSSNVGVYEITKKNWREVFFRITVLNEACGPFLVDENKNPITITPNMIHELIGLWVRGCEKNRTQFMLMIGKIYQQRTDRALKEFDDSFVAPLNEAVPA